jgi:Chaperone of endosialidase
MLFYRAVITVAFLSFYSADVFAGPAAIDYSSDIAAARNGSTDDFWAPVKAMGSDLIKDAVKVRTGSRLLGEAVKDLSSEDYGEKLAKGTIKDAGKDLAKAQGRELNNLMIRTLLPELDGKTRRALHRTILDEFARLEPGAKIKNTNLVASVIYYGLIPNRTASKRYEDLQIAAEQQDYYIRHWRDMWRRSSSNSDVTGTRGNSAGATARRQTYSDISGTRSSYSGVSGTSNSRGTNSGHLGTGIQIDCALLRTCGSHSRSAGSTNSTSQPRSNSVGTRGASSAQTSRLGGSTATNSPTFDLRAATAARSNTSNLNNSNSTGRSVAPGSPAVSSLGSAARAQPAITTNAPANAARNAVSNAASGAVARSASTAASTSASNAASRAASNAASNAASRAAANAASNAASRAASNAASNAASRAASNAASNAAANAASRVRVPSDRRLKRDIVELGVLPNGLHLYRYRYTGDRQYYVGVMAQEVMRVDPAAVGLNQNGFLGVNYDRLGLRFLTWNDWVSGALHAADLSHE